MESIIKLRTGTPKEEGEYLVTRYSPLGKGETYTQTNYYRGGKWLVNVLDASLVIAWYPLREIKPYKE